MKKFIMVAPLQPEGQLKYSVYEAADNERLKYSKDTAFPVIPLINGYVDQGESIEIVVVKHDYDNSNRNYGLFESELEQLAQENGFDYKIKMIEIPYDNSITAHVNVFERLSSTIEDGDIIGGCMTYGSKPLSQVVMMTIHYALRAKKNCSLSAMVYGEFDHAARKSKIYDVSRLFFIDEIVTKGAEMGVKDPLRIVRLINEED